MKGSFISVPTHRSQPHARSQWITAAQTGMIFQSILTFLSYSSLEMNQMRKTAGVFRMSPPDVWFIQYCGDECPELAASTVSEHSSLAMY